MASFAILPAAGRSRRMGAPKLLLPWGPMTLIEQVIRNWTASRVDHVIVVVHPDDELLAAHCQGALVVGRSPAPAEMKDSIRYGLEAAAEHFAAGPGDAWLVAPADMPGLMPAAINALLDAFAGETPLQASSTILAASSRGRRGHPVLFPWQLAAEVHDLTSEQGLNVLLQRHPVTLVEVGDPAILEDIDTPQDYARRRPSV